ncbi:hypothetical protein BDV06DRAFT_218144 [Aspergillus oleicola]
MPQSSNYTASSFLSSSKTTETATSTQQHTQTNPAQPILILIFPPDTDIMAFTTRYRSILSKIQRDAELVFALGLADLKRVLADEEIIQSIAGFVVTDAAVMGIDENDGEMHAISRLLAEIVKGAHSYKQAVTNLGQKTRTRNTGGSSNNTTKRILINHHESTVLFAFDFPAQATLHPLRFKNYMSETFGAGLRWKICGATKNEWTLGINEPGLRKMGGRVYHGNRYKMRAVFLDGVEEEDKVLVVDKGKGAAEPDNVRYSVRLKGIYADCLGDLPASLCGYETESTVHEGENFDSEHVKSADNDASSTLTANTDDVAFPPLRGRGGKVTLAEDLESRREECEWADDELTAESDNQEDDDDDNTDTDTASTSCTYLDTEEQPNRHIIYFNVPHKHGKSHDNAQAHSDFDSDSGLAHDRMTRNHVGVADCAVALHEIRSWTEIDSQRFRTREYVGFVGHVDDNRSMASLILGMCGVQNARPLSELDSDH